MKIVLTGGPCCGKTTLINKLSERGYKVIEEVARQIIEDRIKRFGGIEDYEELQREILRKQITEEEKYNENNLLFLDRGIGDVFAYSQVLVGRVPNDLLSINLKNRYGLVFLLDRLPFVKDGLRMEERDEQAEIIHREIEKVYNDLDYYLERVPLFNTADERVNYILNRVSNIQEMKGGVN